MSETWRYRQVSDIYLPAIAPKLVHGWVDVRDLAVAPKYRENFRHWYKKNQQLTEEEQKND